MNAEERLREDPLDHRRGTVRPSRAGRPEVGPRVAPGEPVGDVPALLRVARSVLHQRLLRRVRPEEPQVLTRGVQLEGRVQVGGRVTTILAGREDEQQLPRLEGSSGERPLERLVRVVRQSPALEVDRHAGAVEDFDPVGPLPVLVERTAGVRRQELVQHHVDLRRLGIDRVAPGCRPQGIPRRVDDAVVRHPARLDVSRCRRQGEVKEVGASFAPFDARCAHALEFQVRRVDALHVLAEEHLDAGEARHAGPRERQDPLDARREQVGAEGVDDRHVDLEVAATARAIESLDANHVRTGDEVLLGLRQDQRLVAARGVARRRDVVEHHRVAGLARHVHPRELHSVDPEDETVVVIDLRLQHHQPLRIGEVEPAAQEETGVPVSHRRSEATEVGADGPDAGTVAEGRSAAGPSAVVEVDLPPESRIRLRRLLDTRKVTPLCLPGSVEDLSVGFGGFEEARQADSGNHQGHGFPRRGARRTSHIDSRLPGHSGQPDTRSLTLSPEEAARQRTVPSKSHGPVKGARSRQSRTVPSKAHAPGLANARAQGDDGQSSASSVGSSPLVG